MSWGSLGWSSPIWDNLSKKADDLKNIHKLKVEELAGLYISFETKGGSLNIKRLLLINGKSDISS